MLPSYFDNNGQSFVTDPYAKAAKKTGNTPFIIDKSVIGDVKKYMVSMFLRKGFTSFEPSKRLLTFEETWLGVEGNEYLGSLKLSSSTGYPYKFLKKTASKKAYFGTFDNPKGFDHPDMLFIRSEFDKQLANLKSGLRNDPVVIEELKIELRPHSKIDEYKTRVFNMSNLVQICIGRCLFGSFVSKVMDGRIYNGSSIGINVATEFDLLKTYLNQVGDNIIAGDYTNYDGTLPPAFIKMFAEVVNTWYNDDYKLARITFIHDLIYSYRVRGNSVFQTLSGQPSGNYLTTIINTFVNIAATCYCYLKISPKEFCNINSFERNVKINAFGDDNLISVSDEIKHFCNMSTLSSAFRDYLGMTYTDETKSSSDLLYKSILDCHYLQCKFVYNERDGVFVGVRDKDKIVETLYWIQTKTLPVKDQLAANVEAVTQEYSRYSLAEYEEFCDELTQILTDRGYAELCSSIVPYEQDPCNDIFMQRYKCSIIHNNDYFF